jgi:hypothetical protein
VEQFTLQIVTEWENIVMTLLRNMFGPPEMEHIAAPGRVMMTYRDAFMSYRDAAAWMGDALGCGLILGGEILRHL